MVPSLIKGVVLVVVGALMIRWATQRSDLVRHGVQTDAIVQAVYGDDPERSSEVWLEYRDQQGQSHWLHGKLAIRPRQGSAMPVRYAVDAPDRAMLASEDTHYDAVTLIFGLYFLGWGLYYGYRAWTS